MFNGLFGLGRAYRKLPAHHNFTELANNIETIANYLLDQSLGSFGNEGYLKAHTRWQNQFGSDLKMFIDYARGSVPPDTDGLHYFSGRGYNKPQRTSN